MNKATIIVTTINRIKLTGEKKKTTDRKTSLGKPRYGVQAVTGNGRLQGRGEGKALCAITFTNCMSLRM